MYFYPGKTKTFARVRNTAAKDRFLEKQLDLFAESNISSPVTPARSEARTAGTGEEKLYVLVTRKVSLTGEKKNNASNPSNPASVNDSKAIESLISEKHHSQKMGGCKVSLTSNSILKQNQDVECSL